MLERLKRFGLYHGMTKLECLEALADQPETFDFNPHFAPQYLFLWRGDDIRVDFIGRLERFNADSNKILQVSGSDKEFPIANRSKKAKPGLTNAERNILHHIYKKDFQLLGYPTQ